MKRIVITGAAGSGKSTLAAQLAAMLGYPFIEPDALFWGPNWTPAPRDEKWLCSLHLSPADGE